MNGQIYLSLALVSKYQSHCAQFSLDHILCWSDFHFRGLLLGQLSLYIIFLVTTPRFINEIFNFSWTTSYVRWNSFELGNGGRLQKVIIAISYH